LDYEWHYRQLMTKCYWRYGYIHICISLTFQPKIVTIFNQKHCESCDMLVCKQILFILALKSVNDI
jgi:hypothetical protein